MTAPPQQTEAGPLWNRLVSSTRLNLLVDLDIEGTRAEAALHDGVVHSVGQPHGVGKLERVAAGARLRTFTDIPTAVERDANISAEAVQGLGLKASGCRQSRACRHWRRYKRN